MSTSGKAAAGRLKTGGDANFFVHGTLSVKPAIAIKAVSAGNVVKNDHAVANSISCDAFAHGCNRTGSFVPVNTRWGEKIVLNLFKVGVANAAACNAD